MQVAIEARVPVYVDLSDPLEYLEAAQAMHNAAVASGTTAVLAAGAFPGLSNVLAVECAARLGEAVQDVKFSYFTAGAHFVTVLLSAGTDHAGLFCSVRPCAVQAAARGVRQESSDMHVRRPQGVAH